MIDEGLIICHNCAVIVWSILKRPHLFLKKLKNFLKSFPAIIRHFDFRFLLNNFKKIDSRFLDNVFGGIHGACISISDECNFKCIFCFEHSDKYSMDLGQNRKKCMDFNTYKQLINDLSMLGIENICLAGSGEPFMHERIMDVVKYARKKKIAVYITTNGLLIDESQVKELVDLCVKEIYFSVEAASDETFSKITGSKPDNFSKILKTIRKMVEYKKRKNVDTPWITITNVITSLNYHEVVEMVKLATRLEVNAVGFHRMFFCSRRKPFLEDATLKPQEIAKLSRLLIEAMYIAKNGKINNNISFFVRLLNRGSLAEQLSYVPRIVGITREIVVLADGTVLILHFPKPIGKINGERFSKLWFSPTYCLMRAKAKPIIEKYKQFHCMSWCRGCKKEFILEEEAKAI